MKKDKEWLKEQVAHEQNDGLYFRENYSQYDYFVDVEDLLPLIDQLGEPETLSQKWINENKVARINNLRKMTTSHVVSVEKLKNLLVPKQDEPVIPQFVANYIEKWKNGGLTMSEWFDFNYGNEEDDEVSKWLYDNDYEENMKREHLLIDAIRYGYEVEELE